MKQTSASQHATLLPRDYVTLAVRDTGTGMDEETKTRIFEPFFTTKEVGKGTGLGLSIVYGIVKQSGGEIAVESALGCGTTVRIYLPELMEPEKVVRAEFIPSTSMQGSETILVVEDQSVVLDLICLTLTRRGYTVLAAGGAQDALRLEREHQGEIALLVTDVLMPHMSGPQLVEQVLRLRPKIKILYMSGYTDGAIEQHGTVAAFFQEPFTPKALERKVRETLDAPALRRGQSV